MSLYSLLEMSSYCVFRNFDYLSNIPGLVLNNGLFYVVITLMVKKMTHQ